MNILGICTFFHDSSACLIQDGQLVAFGEEERFNRKKRTSAYPFHAVEFCLRQGGITLDDVDYVAYNVQPLRYLAFNAMVAARHFPRSMNLLRAGAAYMPVPQRLHRMLTLGSFMRRTHGRARARFRVVYVPHHLSHAAAAFLSSPFEEAAIVTVDAAGQGFATCVLRGEGERLVDLGRAGQVSRYPHSLAGFYSGFTEYLGFRVGTDEYKVMGLSAYGEPTLAPLFDDVAAVTDDGKLELNLDYFDFHNRGVNAFFSPRMEQVFGPARRKGEEVTAHHMRVAASLQATLERLMLKILDHAAQVAGTDNLCLGGGVALNCLMNRRIVKEGPFKRVFVHPVPYDGGGCIGAAQYVEHCRLGRPRRHALDHLYLGPEYSDAEYRAALGGAGVAYDEVPDPWNVAARWMTEGKIVGWFQGRMEGGPRALGNRSLVADPRRAEMKDVINARVKNREWFRPFAPSVIEERASEFFDPQTATPYMIVVSDVVPEQQALIPAVVHVDGTARVQTVSRAVNPRYHQLIESFGRLTGVPVVLNTSFNENEPIVCSPQDAVSCFSRTNVDALVMGNYVASKHG